MAYLTLQINISGIAVGDMNGVIEGGDATKRDEAVANIKNILSALEAGVQSGTIVAVSSTNAGTVSGQTGGVSATFNLT